MLSFYIMVFNHGDYLAKIRISDHHPSVSEYSDPLKTINGDVPLLNYLFISTTEIGSKAEKVILQSINTIKLLANPKTNIISYCFGKTNVGRLMNFITG